MLGEDLLMEVQDLNSPEHRHVVKNDVKIRKKKSKNHNKRPVSYIKVYKDPLINDAIQMNHENTYSNNVPINECKCHRFRSKIAVKFLVLIFNNFRLS